MKSICHRSCETCNMQLHCQGCSFCEMPFCKKDCHQCFSLCPSRGGSFGHLKKIGGGEITLESNENYQLPSHIPIFKDRFTEAINMHSVIGIHPGEFLSANGENVNKRFRERGISGALNIEKEVEGLLEFYVKDRTLEGFWDNRFALYEQLKAFKWRVIMAPNFSVYEDAPRVDHLYNMKRSSIVYNELIQLGFPAAPDISWYNQIDLDQWIREINKNKLQTIGFSFQVVDTRLKRSNIWKHYLMGFKYLCQRVEHPVNIVIAGVVSPNRLKIIQAAAGIHQLSILNQTAYMQSRRGIDSSTGYKAETEISKNDLLIRNLAHYDNAYAKLAKGEWDA